MSTNHNGNYAVPSVPEHILTYDAVPKEIRDLLKYAPLSINARSAMDYVGIYGLDALKARIQQLYSENARAAYGPDHPQAQ